MRKLILLSLLAATAVPGVANAQSRQEIRQDRQELRQDRQELRRDRQEIRRDRRDGRDAYVAPYRGWNYRPVTVGYQLRPAFWGDRYNVSDYGRYQLERPRMNQRWVRYGDDLVLVNIRNGRVLRVIRNRW